MRPLILAFQADPNVSQIDDQFMFGDAFLVAPVLEANCSSRRVYIPEGRWYDFWSGTLTAGPQITRLNAPLNRIPLLVRAGSVIPAWPVMQSTSEHPVESLVLYVYLGDGDSWLYEDDGRSWDFMAGKNRVSHFTCEIERHLGNLPSRLKIKRAVEGTFVPEYTYIEMVIYGLQYPPRDLYANGTPVETHLFDESAHTLTFKSRFFDNIEVVLGEHTIQSLERQDSLL
jgi:hypothetical protein